ncbi:MAG: hypothetical protein GY940_48215 [bacterium]|nr:hypothetical protein [bacterium]
MRPAIIFIILISVVFSNPLFPAKDYTEFNKGVAYILIDDKPLALKHIEKFFSEYQDPALRLAFVNLIKAKNLDVAKEFKRYLDINHRSTMGLVGIGLSTTNMENSTSVGNLKRAMRMQRSFSAAYLCLGMEYMKLKDYPQARANFSLALRYSRVPEYKILLSQLYMTLNDPGAALKAMKPEADRYPDNFYFNYYTAEAFYRLRQLNAMGQYIEAAIEVNPTNNDAQLLLAKYLLGREELKRARTVLKKLRFKDYNEDYTKTFAQVLLKLKDNQSKSYMDQVYSQNRWDKDINRLMGLYDLWKKGRGNVQNRINRSVLSGNSIDQLQKTFPSDYQFPGYKSLPFFEVHTVYWLSNDLLVVAAVKRSGDRGGLYFLQAGDLKVVNVLSYRGRFQDIFFSRDRNRMVFSTVANLDESVNLYGVSRVGRRFVLKMLYNRPIKMQSVVAGFNRAGNLAYITDKSILSQAFISPFSRVSELGQKEPIYNDYPYSIYKYNFATSRLTAIKDIQQMKNVPIDGVKKYFQIYDSTGTNNNVSRLISQGQKLDLTSSSMVKIHFSNEDVSSFLIYLSDLKNAFQAQVVDGINNRTFRIDETMFLGKGEYAQLDIIDFDPEKQELVVITKDKERTLIKFSYRTYLYTRLAEKVEDMHYDKEHGIFYVLTERSKKRYSTSTNLAVIYLNPYFKRIVDDRRDLSRIVSREGEDVYFSTIGGELLRMDKGYQFNYAGPSFDGCLHAASPSGKTTAAYINGKLFLVERIETDDVEKWEQKTNSKK